ncbi:MAG TPA: DNA ligase, partial [Humisphaera sp.]
DAAEEARLGGALPQKPVRATSADGDEGDAAAGPPLLLAESWDNAADLSGWWMSEKLDGVRAYWDGAQFLSRQGNLFHAPDWFVAGLPSVPLDGELWIGRRAFQRTVSVVRRQDKTDLWKEVRYLVFDAPAAAGGFEERVAFVSDALSGGKAKFASPLEHSVCGDVDCLRAELARVEALGGEGLMLRQPGSKYEAGRSSTLLKVKSFKDAEAVVVGHQAGAGKHKGRLGALLVKLMDGGGGGRAVEFAIGTGFSDKERAAPPAVGAVVTFRYQELTEAGVPRFPSYVRVRTDVEPPAAVVKVKQAAAAKPEAAAKAAPTTKAAPAVEPVPTARATPPTAGAGGGSSRYFEYVEGTSSKFWAVSVAGAEVTTRWGRIGSAGQSKTKAYADGAAAAAAAAKLVEEKTADGYVEKQP